MSEPSPYYPAIAVERGQREYSAFHYRGESALDFLGLCLFLLQFRTLVSRWNPSPHFKELRVVTFYDFDGDPVTLYQGWVVTFSLNDWEFGAGTRENFLRKFKAKS